MAELRIATFNVENLDETPPGARPSLAERVLLMRPQIARLRADVLCLQEVNGQERDRQPRGLHALTELLRGTALEGATMTSTRTQGGEVFDERNLVVVSHLPVLAVEQLRNDLVAPLTYRRLTAVPPDAAAVVVGIERPILHVVLQLPDGTALHVVDVHWKSKLATDIPGQRVDSFTWRTADGWAEGSFLSAMKRMAQALETRRLVDQVLDADPGARVVVAGDFNAGPDEVSVLAVRGNVEDTGNPELVHRVLVPIENTVPESSRVTLYHQGRGQMLDHMLVTRNLLEHYRGSEIHNEVLHDESAAFAVDRKYPESDHAPVVATFDLA
ncbi:endonuclease/exonuclease/phosphatase family protein [Cellulomonas cellasea]|uniref:Endonuclease n=2 Tax=Cellulomonas cellasea TaxID=43670 RepID=A0A0A0B1T5_9CELL|nr:endonuclease/exonuclease/phosphatase family protein [Cellulomonas cellasea]KGM00770.1 endonuclease [Cellulomonas cellasea DSM 20118]GEA89093.1 endonuclease [Cellulomonas cellasea]